MYLIQKTINIKKKFTARNANALYLEIKLILKNICAGRLNFIKNST